MISLSKNTILFILLILLVVCGAFLFNANRDARRAYVAEMTTLLKGVSSGEVTGIITELSGDILTLAVDAERFGMDNPPDTLTYTITPETTIIQYVRISDTEVYLEAMNRYNEAIENDPAYRGNPPVPFETRVLAVSDLREGQEVSISIGIVTGVDRIIADRITLREKVGE